MLGDFNQLRPIKARSLAHGTALAERRLKMTVTERYGASLFRMANACVMLDESNRFSPTYAPIMERCLHSKCNHDDVKLLNTCVMGDSASRNASTCFDASIITFRNKVSTILTGPMMRTMCQANGTPLFVARAHDVFIRHQRPGCAQETPPAHAPWPTGLREEVNSLDDAKTKDLPTMAFLAMDAPVVLHKQPQFVLLGVCNNSDGIIRGIELDPREDFIADPAPGYSVVNLRYAPLRVLVYIKTADEAGLHLEGLDRGVIAIAPVEKEFTIVGVGKREFTIRRRQLPLTAGCVSSVFRSQGQTMPKIMLDIRRPPGTAMDPAAVYVALSRATSLDALNLLFPVTLEDLNQPPDKDILALVNYLEQLDRETLRLFLDNPSTFTPASATVDALAGKGLGTRNYGPSRTMGRHGRGATRRVAHLIANNNNNCFFNSALALGLAAWDGQPLPPSPAGTPAAGSFFEAVQLLRDFMFDGSPLQDNVLGINRANREERGEEHRRAG
eukprot:g15522.t1